MTAKGQKMHCGELKFPGTRNRINPEGPRTGPIENKGSFRPHYALLWAVIIGG